MARVDQGITLQLQFEDCELVVRRKLHLINSKVINYQIVPIEDVVGFFGEHMQVYITYSYKGKNNSIICFAKFFPRPHLDVDFEFVSTAFKKEIFVYNILFKNIQKAGITLIESIAPEFYFAKENSVVILEDLTLKGYQKLPRLKYLDYNHVVVIIKALAKLHASSLIYEEKTAECFETYFADYNDTFYYEKKNYKGQMSFFASLKAIITQIDLFNLQSEIMTNEQFKSIVWNVCCQVFNLVKPSKKYRNVICHGDLWSTNFLLKYENSVPKEVMLIDFQIARYVPPAHDIMGFLYITTSRQFRKNNMKKICDIYYEELKQNVASYGYAIEDIIPRSEFDESCEEQEIFGATQTAQYYQLTQLNSDYIERAAKNKEKWVRGLFEDRSEIVLDNYKSDDDYRYKIKQTLKNLRDICEKYV